MGADAKTGVITAFKPENSWKAVTIDAEKDNAIDTVQFLNAAEALTTIFDAVGGTALAFVKDDQTGNIEKLRERYKHAKDGYTSDKPGKTVIAKSPEHYSTIQALVRDELTELDENNKKKHNATEGLLWLVRGHEFTCAALSHNQANQTDELVKSFKTAYKSTLGKHHSMFVRPFFSQAMIAVPYRKDFYAAVGTDLDIDDETLHAELREYLAALDKIVGILKDFLESPAAKW